MAEFDEKLNALLSNPESMAKIMQLAQSLSGQTAADGQAPQTAQPQQSNDPPQAAAAPPPPQQPSSASTTASPGSSDFLSALSGGLDPKLITKLIPVLQELNREQNSDAQRLLYALRPYLKTERQEKVERALQLARLIHLGKKFLSGWEG